MLIVQRKLVNAVDNKCFGVVCSLEDGVTLACLSINKAKELEVQDIDILEYLECEEELAYLNPRRSGYYIPETNSNGFLKDFADVSYERMGEVTDLFNMQEVLYGHIFNYKDFIEIDNEVCIKRALKDDERTRESEF